MYLYLPSQNLLISNEGSHSLDNFNKFGIFDIFDIPKKFDIWKELNWYSAKPANWRGLYCNILGSSTDSYMTYFDKKIKPYLSVEKTKATFFITDYNYYFYMTNVGLKLNKKQLINYTYYNNQEKKYYRFLVINADTLFNFIHSRKYTNFKVRIIDIDLEKL